MGFPPPAPQAGAATNYATRAYATSPVVHAGCPVGWGELKAEEAVNSHDTLFEKHDAYSVANQQRDASASLAQVQELFSSVGASVNDRVPLSVF
jgi:hypothetical protein